MLAVIIALCASFSAIGCAEDEYHPIRVAKEQFGCERILWLDGAHQCNNISGYYLEQGGGKFSRDHVFPQEGGYYVVGEDKSGNEIFVLVPHSDYANSKRYKAAKYDWPFDYSFGEIAAFAGEHGYKFADGIDGRLDEYYGNSGDDLKLNDSNEFVKTCLYESYRNFRDEAELGDLYERLDVKLAFEYSVAVGEQTSDCYIIQIDGKFQLCERRYLGDGKEDELRLYTYE